MFKISYDLVAFVDNEEDRLSAEASVVNCRLLEPTAGLLETSGHGWRRLLNPESVFKLVKDLESNSFKTRNQTRSNKLTNRYQ